VVVAAKGYPGVPKAGGSIAGLAEAEGQDVRVFQAGTARQGSKLVASGGRVLAVTAAATTVAEARSKAYEALKAIRFPSGFHRTDIGWREIARGKKSG
jgi:phosphoribosylamine--glycine ligase